MARTAGVKHKYLILKEEGTIVASLEFVDDYRPKLGIDRRYVRIDEGTGWVWRTGNEDFATADEGNTRYKKALEEGYEKSDERTVLRYRRYLADMTY